MRSRARSMLPRWASHSIDARRATIEMRDRGCASGVVCHDCVGCGTTSSAASSCDRAAARALHFGHEDGADRADRFRP